VPTTRVPWIWQLMLTFVPFFRLPTAWYPVPGPERTVSGAPAVWTLPAAASAAAVAPRTAPRPIVPARARRTERFDVAAASLFMAISLV
jgi:hypothetical protein